MAKKTLTKEQWGNLEEDLSSIFVNRKLLIDGHTITIALERYSTTELRWLVYVDGSIKGSNMNKESEVGRKFWFEKKMKPGLQMTKNMIKLLGVKQAKKYGYDLKKIETVTIGYIPYFKSFRSLKSTLERNNDSIELLYD